MLGHRIGPAVGRHNTMVENKDIHLAQQAFYPHRRRDILAGRGAGSARMVMGQENAMRIHQQGNRRNFPRMGRHLRQSPGRNLALYKRQGDKL